MLKISNLRYEILRDVIISDFSLQLRAGEVKTGRKKKKADRSKTALKKTSFWFKKTACYQTSRRLKISKFLALRA